MYIQIKNRRLYPVSIVLTSLLFSIYSPVYAEDKPREQTFVVTAYYSPLPHQCCYFRGSYEEDITFNGKGTHGADGTPVYPGMIAGPETYAFGTRIEIPGVGIGTIHDRGGRIIEWGEDIHRIDIWMGYGEEGLARALAWGARKMTGTVYPPGSEGTPGESFALSNFNADSSVLAMLPKSDPLELISSVSLGDREYGVRILQSTLKDLGYFSHAVTGEFGPKTQEALLQFLRAYDLPGDGASVDAFIASALTVAQELGDDNLPVLHPSIELGNSGPAVRQLQKLLRYLGYYRGRTDGIFDEHLKDAVASFQVGEGVLGSQSDQFAGRVGPKTHATILSSWKNKVVKLKARTVSRKLQVAETVKSSKIPKKFLSKGSKGKEVKLLQSILADLGYLPLSDVTGTYGDRTTAALLRYQKEKQLITEETDRGAGVFGPATKQKILEDAVTVTWKRVRGEGMGSL